MQTRKTGKKIIIILLLTIFATSSTMIIHEISVEANTLTPPPPMNTSSQYIQLGIPPVEESSNIITEAPSNIEQSSIPPLPPEPDEKHVIDELNHAYSVLQELNNLTTYAISNNVKVGLEVNELSGLATEFYTRALRYYQEDMLENAEVYTHIAIEISHSAIDLLKREMAENGIAIPVQPPLIPPTP